MPVLDIAQSGIIPSGYHGNVVDHTGLWSVTDTGVSTQAKRADPLSWFIAGAAVLAALNYATCNKPDPKWLDSLSCFASSCALGYSGLAAALRGINGRSRKRASNIHIESFNSTIGGLGTYATKPIQDLFSGELHELLSFEVDGLLHQSYYQYIKEEGLHMTRGKITPTNAKRQDGQDSGKDGGVTADYLFNNVDVAEENKIGNDGDDVNGSFEGAFLNSGANDESYAHHVESFCADLKDTSGAYGDLAIRGAYFIGDSGGFPYQPGMAQSIISACHNGE